MPLFSRRTFFAQTAALWTTGSLSSRAQSPGEAGPSLQELAKKSGILFGSAVANSMLAENAKVRQNILRHCSILTPTGAMKWDGLRPSPSTFTFGGGDGFLQFTEQNHMAAHGHTLVWHEALPAWFGSAVNKSNASEMLSQHITTVVRHYRSRIRFWDVVNEIIDPSYHRSDLLGESPWLSLIGAGYIEQAFHLAQSADPEAVLVWNENNLEVDSAYSRAKRRGVVTLLRDLQKRHVPVHALGLQAHLRPTFNKNNADYCNFLRIIKDMGVKLLISELDVVDTDIPADGRDDAVATLYYDFLSTTCRIHKPVSIQVWELSDYRNWMDVSMPQWRRSDGLPHRPAVMDENFVPKLAFRKLQRILQELS